MWLPSERSNSVVHMPVVTIGSCRFVRKCDQWHTDLADGMCQRCWDYTSK